MAKKIFIGFNILIFVLQLIFLILKLTNVINWNWVFAMIPFISYGVFIVVFFGFSICIMASEAEDEGLKM